MDDIAPGPLPTWRGAVWLILSQVCWAIYRGMMRSGSTDMQGWIGTARILLQRSPWIQAWTKAVSVGLSDYVVSHGVARAWWMPRLHDSR